MRDEKSKIVFEINEKDCDGGKLRLNVGKSMIMRRRNWEGDVIQLE